MIFFSCFEVIREKERRRERERDYYLYSVLFYIHHSVRSKHRTSIDYIRGKKKCYRAVPMPSYARWLRAMNVQEARTAIKYHFYYMRYSQWDTFCPAALNWWTDEHTRICLTETALKQQFYFLLHHHHLHFGQQQGHIAGKKRTPTTEKIHFFTIATKFTIAIPPFAIRNPQKKITETNENKKTTFPFYYLNHLKILFLYLVSPFSMLMLMFSMSFFIIFFLFFSRGASK